MAGAQRSGGLVGILITVGAVLFLTRNCGTDHDTAATETTPVTSSTRTAAGPTTAWFTDTPTPAPSYNSMPGNGYHNMGGVEGKNWGTYTSTGINDCTWSIRSVNPDAPADILEEGSAANGEPVTVAINPDGDANLDGIIDGHRLVFQTSGCDTWRAK